MDLDRLRYFCTIYHTGNLHRAAEILRLSPAALSKALRVLEAETGLKLVVPSGRGLAFTEQGKSFALGAQNVLKEFEAWEKSFRGHAAAETTFRIASFEVFSTHFMGAAAKANFPEVELTIRELGPGEMEAAVATGEVDYALTYLPIPRPELDFLKVGALEMGIYGLGKFTKGLAFEELPFVVPVTPISGSPNKITGLDGWPDDLIPRRVRYRVSLLETALELSRQELAVGYFPTFIVELANAKTVPAQRLHPLPLPKTLPPSSRNQNIYLIKRKTDQESRFVKLLAKAIRTIC